MVPSRPAARPPPTRRGHRLRRLPVPEWERMPAGLGRPVNEVHGNAGPRYLGLSADLVAAPQSWADWHGQHRRTAWRDEREPPVFANEPHRNAITRLVWERGRLVSPKRANAVRG